MKIKAFQFYRVRHKAQQAVEVNRVASRYNRSRMDTRPLEERIADTQRSINILERLFTLDRLRERQPWLRNVGMAFLELLVVLTVKVPPMPKKDGLSAWR